MHVLCTPGLSRAIGGSGRGVKIATALTEQYRREESIDFLFGIYVQEQENVGS